VFDGQGPFLKKGIRGQTSPRTRAHGELPCFGDVFSPGAGRGEGSQFAFVRLGPCSWRSTETQRQSLVFTREQVTVIVHLVHHVRQSRPICILCKLLSYPLGESGKQVFGARSVNTGRPKSIGTSNLLRQRETWTKGRSGETQFRPLAQYCAPYSPFGTLFYYFDHNGCAEMNTNRQTDRQG